MYIFLIQVRETNPELAKKIKSYFCRGGGAGGGEVSLPVSGFRDPFSIFLSLLWAVDLAFLLMSIQPFKIIII